MKQFFMYWYLRLVGIWFKVFKIEPSTKWLKHVNNPYLDRLLSLSTTGFFILSAKKAAPEFPFINTSPYDSSAHEVTFYLEVPNDMLKVVIFLDKKEYASYKHFPILQLAKSVQYLKMKMHIDSDVRIVAYDDVSLDGKNIVKPYIDELESNFMVEMRKDPQIVMQQTKKQYDDWHTTHFIG